MELEQLEQAPTRTRDLGRYEPVDRIAGVGAAIVLYTLYVVGLVVCFPVGLIRVTARYVRRTVGDVREWRRLEREAAPAHLISALGLPVRDGHAADPQRPLADPPAGPTG